MQKLSGRAVSPGYARGIAFVFSLRVADKVPRFEITAADVPEEHRRFFEAVAAERLDCVTQDGTRVSLLANINWPEWHLLHTYLRSRWAFQQM